MVITADGPAQLLTQRFQVSLESPSVMQGQASAGNRANAATLSDARQQNSTISAPPQIVAPETSK